VLLWVRAFLGVSAKCELAVIFILFTANIESNPTADFRMECPPVISFMGLYSLACFFLFPLGIPFLFWSLLMVSDGCVRESVCLALRLCVYVSVSASVCVSVCV
jgi:hypothetical protein